MSGGAGLALVETLLATLGQAPLILGPVVFLGHEVPARIRVGGKQTSSIHRLPGGGRIIDTMGADDGAIAWTGYFTGPFAAARARMVDAIRRNGSAVGLSFGDYAFTVVVVSFDYDIQDRGAVISYRLRAEIVPTGILIIENTAAGIAASIVVDLLAASALLPANAGAGAFNQAQDLLGSATAPTSTLALASVGSAISAGGQALQLALSSTGSRLLDDRDSFDGNGVSPTLLTGMTQDAGQLATITQSAGYVNRSQSNLNQLAGLPQGDPLVFA